MYLYVRDNIAFAFRKLTLKKVIVYINPRRIPIADSGAKATSEYHRYLRRKTPSVRDRLLAYALKDIDGLRVLIKWLRLKSEEMGLAHSEPFQTINC